MGGGTIPRWGGVGVPPHLPPPWKTLGVGCKLDFRFFSIVWHARKPAARGMASQHLGTFKRGYLKINEDTAGAY